MAWRSDEALAVVVLKSWRGGSHNETATMGLEWPPTLRCVRG